MPREVLTENLQRAAIRLHEAVRNQGVDFVKAVLAELAKLPSGQMAKIIKARDEESGETPLHFAVQNERADVVRMLLNAGADANGKCSFKTPLLYDAASTGNTDIVQMLLNAGADVNAKDRMGCPPLYPAVGWKHSNVVQMLLDAGADVNDENRNGAPLLGLCFEALDDANIAIAATLLNAGARITKDGIGFVINSGLDVTNLSVERLDALARADGNPLKNLPMHNIEVVEDEPLAPDEFRLRPPAGRIRVTHSQHVFLSQLADEHKPILTRDGVVEAIDTMIKKGAASFTEKDALVHIPRLYATAAEMGKDDAGMKEAANKLWDTYPNLSLGLINQAKKLTEGGPGSAIAKIETIKIIAAKKKNSTSGLPVLPKELWAEIAEITSPIRGAGLNLFYAEPGERNHHRIACNILDGKEKAVAARVLGPGSEWAAAEVAEDVRTQRREERGEAATTIQQAWRRHLERKHEHDPSLGQAGPAPTR